MQIPSTTIVTKDQRLCFKKEKKLKERGLRDKYEEYIVVPTLESCEKKKKDTASRKLL